MHLQSAPHYMEQQPENEKTMASISVNLAHLGPFPLLLDFLIHFKRCRVTDEQIPVEGVRYFVSICTM